MISVTRYNFASLFDKLRSPITAYTSVLVKFLKSKKKKYVNNFINGHKPKQKPLL